MHAPDPTIPTEAPVDTAEMLAEYAERQARLSRINQLSWTATLLILALLITATIGLGRLHLAYLLCSLVALFTRALPVVAEYSAVVPGFLHEPRFRTDSLRHARQVAHDTLRASYLEPLLVSAGKWRQEEAREAMGLDEVEAIVDGLDMRARQTAFRVALGLWALLATGFVITMVAMELAYQRGDLHTEGGLLRHLLGTGG